MEKKSMAVVLIFCFLTFALLSSAPLLSDVWLGMSMVDSSNSNATAVVGFYSAGLWAGICATAGFTAGASVAVGLVVGA